MAVKSLAEVRSTATYHEPPATVKAHVIKAVFRRMYMVGDFCDSRVVKWRL